MNQLFKAPIFRLYSFLRFVILHFIEDDCSYRASALTFTSLLAIVPITVVGLGILSAFPVFKDLAPIVQNFIFANFVPETGRVVQSYLLQFATQVQQLSMLGILFLMLTALLMMYTIEHSMNQIWRVQTSRKGISALLLYWAIVSLTPVFLGLSLAISSYILSWEMFDGDLLHPYLYHLIPFILSWFGFSFLYIVVPNCHVRLQHGLTGGLFAAIFFELAKHAFATYLKHYSSYELLYGAFATIPILFIWIYWVWIISLLGAEISYGLSAKHERRIGQPIDGFNHALLWLYVLWQAQQSGKSLPLHDLIDATPCPYTISVPSMLNLLIKAKLIEKTEREYFILSRDLTSFTLKQLYELLPFPIHGTPHPTFLSQEVLMPWQPYIQQADEELSKLLASSLEQVFQHG